MQILFARSERITARRPRHSCRRLRRRTISAPPTVILEGLSAIAFRRKHAREGTTKTHPRLCCATDDKPLQDPHFVLRHGAGWSCSPARRSRGMIFSTAQARHRRHLISV
jgi:hypothetical protein